ncbi:hypothetical protein BK816_06605 [Boudabousia tangfeifanii]|uniref:MobA-like NTP transferase domain-containing protein n=1 Tax=Boudabousia tangfeifanii TaxID=1912795 RepID=A0A1D9MLD0_9ACTO|nr:NTP transferase domain-containing protein [Boudabousia tangfeifanii]AOZ72999.1 hypothetical protein BK816_06605 [Boudabousia tangfeifanii]
MRPAAVIILAAGKGTRMKSPLPKVLHPLAGKSLLERAIIAAQALDPRVLGVVVRHERDMVVEHLSQVAPNAIPLDQDEIPGTGRALACALEQLQDKDYNLDGPVVVTSGDVPLLSGKTLQNFVAAHEAANATVSVAGARLADPTGYGRLVEEDGKLVAIVEHADATEEQRQIDLINAGIYVFDGRFALEALQKLGSDNAQGEVYLTDLVGIATESGLPAQSYLIADTWEVTGCNDPQQLAELEAEYYRRHPQEQDSVNAIDAGMPVKENK